MILNTSAPRGTAAPFTRIAVALFALAGAIVPATPSLAAEPAFTLHIEGHAFTPDSIEVPAGERIRLTVVNDDTTPEEFESGDLHVEKIIPGGASADIMVGPLQPGTYEFEGEFHADTARGTLVAK